MAHARVFQGGSWNMKLNRLLVLSALGLGMLPAAAAAQMELYLNDYSGDPSQVEIAPGASFQVQVGLGMMEQSLGLSFWLNISDNGSGLFWLADRVVDPACPFADLITDNAGLLVPADALLDPYHERDLGGLSSFWPDSPPLGIYPMALITIGSSASTPPGTYTLIFVGAEGVSMALEGMPITGSTYTIIVTDGTSDGGDGPGTGGDPGTGGNTGGPVGDPGSTGDPGDTSGGNGDTTMDGNNDGSSTGGDGTTENPTSQADGTPDTMETSDNPPTEVKSALAPRLAECGAGTGMAAVGALLCLGLMRPLVRRQ